jgi:hypothetical protein
MFVTDAVGGRSQVAHHTGIERLSHAGAVPTTALAVTTELFLDRAGPLAGLGVADAEKLAAAEGQ